MRPSNFSFVEFKFSLVALPAATGSALRAAAATGNSNSNLSISAETNLLLNLFEML